MSGTSAPPLRHPLPSLTLSPPTSVIRIILKHQPLPRTAPTPCLRPFALLWTRLLISGCFDVFMNTSPLPERTDAYLIICFLARRLNGLVRFFCLWARFHHPSTGSGAHALLRTPPDTSLCSWCPVNTHRLTDELITSKQKYSERRCCHFLIKK